MSEIKLIVGLGNPGKDYEFTRHNLGFLVIRYLANQYKLEFKKCSFANALMAEGIIDGEQFILLLPTVYMNSSGAAIKPVLERKNISLKNLLVICDDLNLDFGQLRLRAKGSDGGHNGLASIIEHLGTEGFARLRMGISQPKSKGETVSYVLQVFTVKEKDDLNRFIDQAAECCLLWLKDGVQKAMAKFNRVKR